MNVTLRGLLGDRECGMGMWDGRGDRREMKECSDGGRRKRRLEYEVEYFGKVPSW